MPEPFKPSDDGKIEKISAQADADIQAGELANGNAPTSLPPHPLPPLSNLRVLRALPGE